MRTLISIALVFLLAACAGEPVAKAPGQVMIVDRHGTPIPNGVLIPVEENPPSVPRTYDAYELKDRASDAQGIFHVDLEDCVWTGDGCYHFRIHRAGYDDFEMAVSKELFPPVLKIVMVEKAAEMAPPAGMGH